MSPADDTRPLAGVTVLVTRAKEQAGSLVRLLEAAGASVRTMPVIEFIDPEDWGPADRAIGALETYDWIVFSSANAVDRFVARLRAGDTAFPSADAVQVAAVGPATAKRCRSHGIEPDMVPDKAVAEGLIERFEQLGVGEGVRVLLPRALEAREVLPDTLRARGALVDVVPVYRTVGAPPDPVVVADIAAGRFDAVAFASPSSVDRFFAALEGTAAAEAARGLLLASIGPVTTTALERHGLSAHAEAGEHTARGLVDALVARVTGTSGDAEGR